MIFAADLWLHGVPDAVRDDRHLARVMGLTATAIAECKAAGAPVKRPAEFFQWYLTAKGKPRDQRIAA